MVSLEIFEFHIFLVTKIKVGPLLSRNFFTHHMAYLSRWLRCQAGLLIGDSFLIILIELLTKKRIKREFLRHFYIDFFYFFLMMVETI